VAFLLLSGMVTTPATYAKPSEPTTEMKVPASPMPRQSSERFSMPATFSQPNAQSNDRPLCFYQRSDSTIVDLSKLCGAKSTGTGTNAKLENAPVEDKKTPIYW
jgi:hypothetical protein